MKRILNKIKKILDKIISIRDKIITASGLRSSFLGEVVKFKTPGSELIGQVLNLEKKLVHFKIKKIELNNGFFK